MAGFEPGARRSELKTEKREREPWPQELLDAYRAACAIETRERLVMELCVGTGQRIGDVLNMRWSNIEDGGVLVRQSKTSKELWVPILPELQAALDAASRHSVFILTNERGANRWSYRGASAAVRKVSEQIGALDYDIHSWRYNAACELLEASAAEDDLHQESPPSPGRALRLMVQHYTQEKKVPAREQSERRCRAAHRLYTTVALQVLRQLRSQA
jgi:integrase